MARRKRKATARFEDLPKRLQFAAGQSREVADARARWLAEHDLTVVDYLGWVHAQRPQVPARRTGPLPDDTQQQIKRKEQPQ